MKIRSFAKINYFLHVEDKRKDGFYNIQTAFQEVDFYDELEILPSEQFEFQCNSSLVDANINTCTSAFKILKKKFPKQVSNVSIFLNKKIPIGSGLGGGSSNGTSTLKALNTFFSLKLTAKDLEKIALQIGSDCPFFVGGGLQFGGGRGEILTPCIIRPKKYFVLVVPQVSVSTKTAFSSLKNNLFPLSGVVNLAGFENLLTNNKFDDKLFNNHFEMYVFKTHPEIGIIKKAILDSGADFASLSGTGSTVFGVFSSSKKAKKAAEALSLSHNVVLSKPRY